MTVIEKTFYRAYFDGNMFPLNFYAYNDDEAIRIALAHETPISKIISLSKEIKVIKKVYINREEYDRWNRIHFFLIILII